ncbi:HupE/UreJ family protein [Mesorhizobium sp.]|uniref:HupE/UreJ family protein n=1 Tax=Mesorhizobium sp. TaxID=1871066 RepID=UPI000FE5952A|nr:HupE/UreJ family protein [Mesorhizobium sp.]RWA79240.1 MAG: HupE/UreJ family protein [Mesorhizobium sp.]
MIRSRPTRIAFAAMILATACSPAWSHTEIGSAGSFGAGFAHPLSGLDHIMVMVAAGLWSAQKGGRALWAWPATFVGTMLVGCVLGIAGLPVPIVEPIILASILTLGVLTAAAADIPVLAGAIIIGCFAFFHGHTHGTEIQEATGRLEYLTGFVLATALLHGAGIGMGLLPGQRFRCIARLAGAAIATTGLSLIVGAV